MELATKINNEPETVEKEKPKAFRFDVFKGEKDENGKIHKVKSVGGASIVDGCKTYSVYLKTFLNDVFYLLPERKKITKADYIILTREPSQNPKRKYFWNNVGEGQVLSGENSGLVALKWDVLGASEIYLNLYPRNPTGE
jgi:hypothetical protein